MNSRTSTFSSGRYAVTGAPTPASAAATVFRYSFSRSIASRPASAEPDDVG
jgi:hypothetical protein